MRLQQDAVRLGMVTNSTFSMLSPPRIACWANHRIFWKLRSVSTLFWNTWMNWLIFVTFLICSSWSTMAVRNACWVLMRPRSPSG